MNCDKCGKNMESENGTSVGMMIQVSPANNDKEREFLDRQFGKYAGKPQFGFCFECFVDAMMGVK